MTIDTSAKSKKPRNTKKMTGDKSVLTKGAQAKARIISEAETLFNKQGFDGASMRDIAAAAEMQPASVYYHFESKEELLWAVWEKGGVELLDRVKDAIADKTDPWQRMETACIAHTTGLLDWRRANQALFVMPPWHYPESIKARVIALRDEYEKLFVGLIDALPLRKGVDRRYLRLAVMGALSWSLFWFKKERDTPAAIAKQMLLLLRAGVEDTKSNQTRKS
jgi:TetR/AcrR family transcriptional regulator, cholesterol catabolism regulator